MRKLIYAILIIISLFGYSSCREDLTREVTIRNDIDTTVLFSCEGDVTHVYKDFPISAHCFGSWMHKIEPRRNIVCTVVLDPYTKEISTWVYKDLSGEDHNINTIKDCKKVRNMLKLLSYRHYTEQKLDSMKYTIVLDSLTLGLKSPE